MVRSSYAPSAPERRTPRRARISTALASFALPVDGPSMGVTSELDSARLSDRERLLASSRASGVPPPTFRIAALPVESVARRLPDDRGEAPYDEVVTKVS